jgi:hypothetical protein
MKKGIIYLIQPLELLGTRTYKIGCLKNHDIDVLKGSRIIYIIECDNQYKVKYYIKEDMKKEFEGDLIKGNITIIKDQFLDLVKKYSEYKDNYHDYILDDNSDKDDDDDIIDEITTYEDYIKTSKISHIVITEPKFLIGYFLIEKDNIWSHFDRINPLIDFLEINCGNYDYNYKKIIEDMRIKCFNKDYKGNCLKYNEYFMTSNDKYYIFNSKNLKFIKYDPITKILTDKLLINNFFESANKKLYYQSYTDETEVNKEIEHFNTLNIDKVNNIFCSLIDDSILQDYKKLCYNIFVKQKEDIIFYDYSDDNYILSEWLLNIMKILFFDCVYEYNENNIKNIKLEIPRMIIINSNNISESQLNDIITEIKNIGIKNIIIKNSTKNMYKSKIEYNKYDLYYTYFKWCCTK